LYGGGVGPTGQTSDLLTAGGSDLSGGGICRILLFEVSTILSKICC
jgi:hypothetical protein